MSKAKSYDSYAVEVLYTIKNQRRGTDTREWLVWCGNIDTYERAKATLVSGQQLFEKNVQLRIVGYICEVIEDES